MILKDKFYHHVDQEYALDDALGHVKVTQLRVRELTFRLVDGTSVHVISKCREVGVKEGRKDAK